MVFLIRFTPGLRIAIAVACACAGVPARRFTVINFLSAVAWAVSLLALVGNYGPRVLARFGLGGWQGGLLTGVIVIVLFVLLGALERRAILEPSSNG
jgi:membrane protein DedA with SNARE-associated domain